MSSLWLTVAPAVAPARGSREAVPACLRLPAMAALLLPLRLALLLAATLDVQATLLLDDPSAAAAGCSALSCLASSSRRMPCSIGATALITPGLPRSIGVISCKASLLTKSEAPSAPGISDRRSGRGVSRQSRRAAWTAGRDGISITFSAPPCSAWPTGPTAGVARRQRRRPRRRRTALLFLLGSPTASLPF